MKYLNIPLVSLLLIILLLHAQSTQAQFECPGAPPSRLQMGAVARVTPGDPNNVRDQAARSAPLVGQIPGGETFAVIGGPTCADGFVWWQVDYDGLVGWTVEGNDSAYFLELIATPTPTSTPTLIPTATPIPSATPTPGATLTPSSTPTAAPHPLVGMGRIAFVTNNNQRLPREQQTLSIYTVNTDGTDLRVLLDDIPERSGVRDLRWSPDGALLAFESFGIQADQMIPDTSIGGSNFAGRLYLLDVQTAEVVYLSPETLHARHPVWSPDGSQLALIVDVENTSAVYVMDRDGANLQRIVEPRRRWWYEGVDWSPDGTRLAAALQLGDNYDIYVYEFETERWQQVTTNVANDYNPYWSYDGRVIYFRSLRPEDHLTRTGIYRIALGSTSTRMSSGAYIDGGHNVSPDGRWAAAGEAQNPGAGITISRVIVRSRDGGTPIPVTDYLFQDLKEIAWGPGDR